VAASVDAAAPGPRPSPGTDAAPPPAIDAGAAIVDAARRKQVHTDRAPADARIAIAMGTVRVSASPWARVAVIGRTESCIETPCELTLPHGTHRLRLENPVANVGAVVEVVVREGETSTVVETLTRPLAP
jgi:hypothetical protein